MNSTCEYFHAMDYLREISISSLSEASAYFYILQCCDGSFYCGSTSDMVFRLGQHHAGEGANFTSKRLPVRLVYVETFDRIDWAFNREKQIQRWGHAKKLALITGNIARLKFLARGHDRDREIK